MVPHFHHFTKIFLCCLCSNRCISSPNPISVRSVAISSDQWFACPVSPRSPRSHERAYEENPKLEIPTLPTSCQPLSKKFQFLEIFLAEACVLKLIRVSGEACPRFLFRFFSVVRKRKHEIPNPKPSKPCMSLFIFVSNLVPPSGGPPAGLSLRSSLSRSARFMLRI